MKARQFAAEVYVELKATTRRWVSESFGTQASAAAATRVEQSAISDYGSTAPDNAEKFMPIDVLLDLIKAGGNTLLLKSIADRCNCLLVPVPAGTAGDVAMRTGRSAKEFGDVMVRIGEALCDGMIDADEAAKILAEIREVMLELSALAESVNAHTKRGHGHG